MRPRDDDPISVFLAALPDDRRATMTTVHEVIRLAAPELVPAMWGTTIGYGTYHYRYASGREGDSFVVGLANNTRTVSLHLSAVVDGTYVAEANADRLGKVSVGRSCVRFRHVEDVDLDVVAELVRVTADELADGLDQTGG